MVFQSTVMTRHQLSRLQCTVLCCTVYRHCLGIPMPYHGFSPCTVTVFHVLSWLSQSAVIWLSQSAGMSFPCTCKSFPCILLRQWFSCITKPSQSRNPYSSCTNLWISASLLPWHNLCNETFHVEFFFSANNFPSPPPHDANRIFCPKNIGIMPILGIRAPPPTPPQHFSRALALVRVIPPLPKRIIYVRTCMQCRLCFMRAAETKFHFPSPLLGTGLSRFH